MLVKHLDEASNPSSHSYHSHSFFEFHPGSECSFFDDEYDDEYDEYGDEYYDSDEEVAFYLFVTFFRPQNNKLTSFVLRYVFGEILKNRYPYVNRDSRQ